MKRALSLFLAVLMALSVAGCGGSLRDVAEEAADDVHAEKLMTLEVASDVPESLDVNLLNYAVSLATYPENVPYPNETDFLTEEGKVNQEAYNYAYQEWLKDESARPTMPENTANLNRYFRSAAAQFLTGDGNRVCSPLNIYMALAMLAEASGGDSRKQILDLLGAENIETLRTQANGIWNALFIDNGTTARLLGSSLWLNEKMKFKEDTLDTIAKNYYASSFIGPMGTAVFDTALRSWLNEQTRNLLKEQASGLKMDADTLLAIAATVYFKAPWADQFNKNLTSSETFHAPAGDVQAPFMRNVFTGTYYRGQGFGAVSLALSEGNMWLILPDEGITPAALLTSGAAMDFLSDTAEKAEATRALIQLYLPKFDVSSDIQLKDSLNALGVKDIFQSDKANFTPLSSEKAVLSKIQHAARVKIDEGGCEAAAFTVAMATATSAMEQPPVVDFNLNRPFLFAVTAQRNLPLFVGVVAKPAAA